MYQSVNVMIFDVEPGKRTEFLGVFEFGLQNDPAVLEDILLPITVRELGSVGEDIILVEIVDKFAAI